MIPFLTHMTTSTEGDRTLLHPYIAAKINHNVLNFSKAMNIAHTIFGTPYNSQLQNEQPQEMGSDTVVLIGLKNLTVSKFILFYMVCHLIAN